MYATDMGRLDCCKKLMSLGSDKQARARHGLSALHLAASNGHLETAKYLIEEGPTYPRNTSYSQNLRLQP